jgi:excisionase family DNA binding protein
MSTRATDQQPIQSLLTPDEVAALLGTSRIFVIRASRAGKIPALKIGKCYRYRPKSIQTWLREQELLNAIEHQLLFRRSLLRKSHELEELIIEGCRGHPSRLTSRLFHHTSVFLGRKPKLPIGRALIEGQID